MLPFNVLDPSLPLQGNLFIQASAGTGKTFAIEHLAIRFLLEPSHSVDQLLIVTFTKAAVKTLKSRLFARLLALEEELLHPPCQTPYLASLSDRGQQDALHNIQHALSSYDQLHIQTIHSFALEQLYEHSFDLGITAQEEPLLSFEMLKKYTHAFLVSQASNLLSTEQLEILLSSCRYNLRHLTELITHTFRTPPPVWPKLSIPIENRPSLEAFVRCFTQTTSKEGTFYPSIRVMIERALKTQSYSLLWLHTTPQKLKKRYSETDWEKYAAIQQEVEPLHTAFYSLANITHVFVDAAQRSIHTHTKNPLCFYDDYLSLLQQRIGDPSIYHSIQNRYQRVLIDEFQDTDPVQWDIFSRLFLPTNSLVVVGDFKQSIYRFRNADVYTYLTAKRSFTQCYSLQTNYRSTPLLVEGLNVLFQAPFLSLPQHQEVIPYEPVTAGRESSTTPSPSILFLETESEETMVDYVMNQIIASHRQGTPLEQCAICVRDRFQGKRVAQRALLHNLPYTLTTSSTWEESHALRFMIDLIEALAHPHHRGSLLKLWTHPILGDTLTTCEQRWIEHLPSMERWRTLYTNKGITALILHLLEDPQLLLGIFETEGGSPFYHDLLHLSSLFPKRTSPLEERNTLFSLLNEPYERDQGEGIRIMTIHASKGLEFAIVFPVGLALPHKEPPHDQEEFAAEAMRLLYVALTRASSLLYLPMNQNSLLHSFLSLRCREESLASLCSRFPQMHRVPLDTVPIISLPQQECSLSPPSFWPEFYFTPRYLHSFSSLAESKPTHVETSSSLPGGSFIGSLLHTLLEQLPFSLAWEPTRMEEWVQTKLRSTPLEEHTHEVFSLLYQVLHLPLPGITGPLTLLEVSPLRCWKELEFFYSTPEGIMKGFIDLFFEHEGWYYFIDWKTNILAQTQEEYTPELLQQAMEDHDYLLQGKLYYTALHHYLSTWKQEHRLCKAFYLFLRGGPYGIYTLSF